MKQALYTAGLIATLITFGVLAVGGIAGFVYLCARFAIMISTG